jgi:hypothetical protein
MKVFELLNEAKPLDKFKARSLTKPKKSQSEEPIKMAQQAADLIRTQCSNFVEAYRETGKFIYRGVIEAEKMTSSSQLLIAADIRQDRKPVFLDQKFQKVIDSAMESLGLKARRGNSIFCTTHADTSSDWGQTYILFVKDDWTGTVFEEVKDSYVYNKIMQLKKVTDKSDDIDEKISISARALKLLGPKSFNTSSELAKVINDKYQDILITGSGYIGLKLTDSWDDSEKDHDFAAEVLNLLGIEKKK